jgi:hypothetical protein
MIALLSVALASMIDQDAAHDLRCVCEKHAPVAAWKALLLHETQIGLVHETAGVERYEPLLPGQLSLRQSPELGVDDCEQIVARLRVTSLRAYEQSCDVRQGSSPPRTAAKPVLQIAICMICFDRCQSNEPSSRGGALVQSGCFSIEIRKVLLCGHLGDAQSA